ncbi:MAG: RNA methyltransferase [Ignavibacteria bacterium]|nr:RNA methyltransferase [Ignavibacteria bacterium]MBP7093723.1 RNA methyltransferase [Candidatus Kapabacteria bacterium]MBK6417789.1 RNA methyltransferase [Ignavibacteria bacterium]MBK6760820.1 RNA methyltransferase [Ignavibacteria bacterium]MBK7185574.1 RNA methyltransferase [Ignavibacteria bacterium]
MTPERKARIEHVLRRRQPTLTVVFENVHDLHNVSAVLRSCDAVGVLEAFAIYNGGQVFPGLGQKSSGGAFKWIPIHLFETVEECYAAIRAKGFAIYTTHLAADSVSLHNMDLTKPVALVFGNEHEGVTEEARTAADGNFLVPQMGMVQSLNISVACAVSLYEAMRQRMVAGMYDTPQIAPAELEAMITEWSSR